jgi:hypothetical protein
MEDALLPVLCALRTRSPGVMASPTSYHKNMKCGTVESQTGRYPELFQVNESSVLSTGTKATGAEPEAPNHPKQPMDAM